MHPLLPKPEVTFIDYEPIGSNRTLFILNESEVITFSSSGQRACLEKLNRRLTTRKMAGAILCDNRKQLLNILYHDIWGNYFEKFVTVKWDDKHENVQFQYKNGSILSLIIFYDFHSDKIISWRGNCIYVDGVENLSETDWINLQSNLSVSYEEFSHQCLGWVAEPHKFTMDHWIKRRSDLGNLLAIL